MASPGALEGLSACECPVCFNILSEQRNAPMSMPCGHTLCSQCVDGLVAKATSTAGQLGVRRVPTFQCPLCREWVNRESIHLNVTLRDLLVELSRVGRTPSSSGPWLPAQHVHQADIQYGSLIDRGAYGEVFRGVWQGNDVAVKVFSAGLLTSEGLASFQREVFVMNCLRHPNVVLLLGACQTPPKLSIIMEYVAGGSLHKLLHIDKVSLSSEDTASIGLGICRGLQYLHSINILHRDLKSKNVLLTGPPPTGAAKLCDFGLARMRLESATMTGNVGTVHWSAPEVLSNQRYQFPADVYGLGMVLYEMASGRVPFQDMIPLAVMMTVAIQREQPEMPTSANPKLVQIIQSCIEWDPLSRSSVSSVISQLMDLLPQPTLLDETAKPSLQHQDSLGVVFVSVTDSADLANDNLVDIAKEMGIVKGEELQLNEDDYAYKEEGGESEVLDFELAQHLQESEQEAQLERDRELAEQLQMKENTYRTPVDEVPLLAKPPKAVLESYQMVNKRDPVLKSATNAPPTNNKVTPPTKQMFAQTRPTSNIVKKSKTHSKSKVLQSKSPSSGASVSAAFHAPPPAPPPLPPIARTHPPRWYQRSRSVMSQRRVLLQEVRRSGKKVASKLRPTETIEKRAFRVGHVVGGYSSEVAQYSIQNLIKSFNRRWLKPVKLVEPPPAFPVGSVVEPKRGEKVKQVSQMFRNKRKETAANSRTTPTHKLHPAIRAAIESYPFKKLEHVVTSVKQSLPTKLDIEREKKEIDEAKKREQRAKTTPTHRLHPAIRAAIESYPFNELEHVVTSVKQSLPTKLDIERERKEIAEAEKREQVSSDEEYPHGFW